MAVQCPCGAFFEPGQTSDMVQDGCPSCGRPYREPYPPGEGEMTHGLQSMPTSTQDDMSGNPLKEGILGDWKNRDVRDESFAASVKRSDFPSLFEAIEPEFETSQLVLPQDLYRHAMETEAAHRANVQLPNGITDNLHTTLGNLGAWVENPYENGKLRPYYNKYWKTIRPSFSKPSSLQVGVADPTMAEIINHVAQTDDLSPLYEYRGKQAHVKTAGPELLPFLPAAAEVLAPAAEAGATDVAAMAGGDAAGAAVDTAAGGEAAASAGDASNTGGVAGMMKKVLSPKSVGTGAGFEIGKGVMAPVVNYADDLLGMGAGGGAGGAAGGGMPVQDSSYYSRTASDEDDAHPDSHDEVPKQEDGDYKQKDDGNSHEWQRDISVNDIGGTEHSPSFNPAGPAFERFMMMVPLLMQYLNSGEDGSQDPLIQGLHQSLEGEIPGYLDHADDGAADHLVMVLSPKDKASEPAEPEKNEPDHTDENSGGKHESKVVSLNGEAAEFLPDLNVTLPALRNLAAMYPHRPSEIPEGILSGPVSPQEEPLDSGSWPKSQLEECPFCGHYGPVNLGLCGGCNREIYPHGQGQAQAMEYAAKTSDTQGPTTPEQIQAVQQFLIDNAQELGLEGQELIDTVLSVPTNPLQFADVLAQITQRDGPPTAPDGLSAEPPAPAQESAPPEATMPMPGMAQQMMSAIERYGADSVATACPECGSHTTELLDNDGTSKCHACQAEFKTEGKTPNTLKNESHKQAGDPGYADSQIFDLPAQGVPAADQAHQEDVRQEQDSGHTWLDEDENPLKVGQQYEMYSAKYDIPDLVRIEAVKPSSIVYTLTGEYGLQHSTELTKQEANIERIAFEPTNRDGELGVDDYELEDNNDDNTGYTGSPEHRDLSAPSGVVSAGVHESNIIASGVEEHDNPNLAWLMDGVSKTAGANYTPMEQRALIEESGIARNADYLDLANTHYITDAEEDQFLFGF